MGRRAQGGPREAQGRPRGGAREAQGGPREAQGGPREGGPRGGQGGVGPRAQWAQCYLRLSDNCCCHWFCLLLSWFFWLLSLVFWAAVIGFCGPLVFSSFSAEISELKNEKTRRHIVHPSFFILQLPT